MDSKPNTSDTKNNNQVEQPTENLQAGSSAQAPIESQSHPDAPPPYIAQHVSELKDKNYPLTNDEGRPLINNQPQPILINQPGIIELSVRGPATILCPFENIPVITEVSYEPGLKSGVCSAAMCFLFWPLFWLPLVTKSFKEEIHRCPSCQRVLAISL